MTKGQYCLALRLFLLFLNRTSGGSNIRPEATDARARVFAYGPDTRRLKSLSLASNMLTPEGCALFGRLNLPKLRCDGQRPEGSDEYRYSGDME